MCQALFEATSIYLKQNKVPNSQGAYTPMKRYAQTKQTSMIMISAQQNKTRESDRA